MVAFIEYTTGETWLPIPNPSTMWGSYPVTKTLAPPSVGTLFVSLLPTLSLLSLSSILDVLQLLCALLGFSLASQLPL